MDCSLHGPLVQVSYSFPAGKKDCCSCGRGVGEECLCCVWYAENHDNGREFVNQIVTETVKSWPGETAIITGRPRHPQSQGMVEQGNAVVKRLLGNRIMDWRAERAETCAGDDDTDVPWAKWLMRIQCKCVCVCVRTCVRVCVRACDMI